MVYVGILLIIKDPKPYSLYLRGDYSSTNNLGPNKADRGLAGKQGPCQAKYSG